MQKRTIFFIFFMSLVGCTIQNNIVQHVVREKGEVFIVDRTGYRWNVTEAETLGFKPERFQYGLGKNAFFPLDDSYLSHDDAGIAGDHRIIGVEDGINFQAYSVSRLSRHEISNSNLGSKPIAVGY